MKYNIRYKIANMLKKAGVNFDAAKCPEVVNMKEVIEALSGGSIQFTVSREANGDWIAESVNIQGILTGGNATDDINKMIKDAIFTYFEIPARYCDDSLIREAGEPAVIRQELFATS